MKRKLLMIAYYAPPNGDVGTVRITKFVKYLKRLNWHIKVLTMKEKHYKNFNYDWLQEIRNVEVVRTERLPKFMKNVNEEGFYWTPYLVYSFCKINKKFRPDIIFFTGGPFYHWMTAPVIRILFGIPYVLDMRDPWALHPYTRKKTLLNKVARVIERIAEHIVVKYSSLVINVTEQASEMYKRHYPQYVEKFVTIPNGYDPEDFLNIKPIKFSQFDIVYAGKFGDFRDPGPFLEGFKKIINENCLAPDDIRFVCVGTPENRICTLIKKMGLRNHTQLVGFKPYRENLRYIKGADLCLLVAGSHPYEPTTKIFDYLAARKPVIAFLKKEGFLSCLLKDYPNSTILLNASPNEVCKVFSDFVMNKNGCESVSKSSEEIFRRLGQKFNRLYSAEKLSKYLCSVVLKFQPLYDSKRYALF